MNTSKFKKLIDIIEKDPLTERQVERLQRILNDMESVYEDHNTDIGDVGWRHASNTLPPR